MKIYEFIMYNILGICKIYPDLQDRRKVGLGTGTDKPGKSRSQDRKKVSPEKKAVFEIAFWRKFSFRKLI